MTPIVLLDLVIRPALLLLPSRMDTADAELLLLATAYQETKLKFRRQMPSGPARGWWQMEGGPYSGIAQVLTHKATADLARETCEDLCVPLGLGDDGSRANIHEAMEYCDLLAAVFARLLYYTDRDPLPKSREDAYSYYVRNWHPGHERPEDWLESWERARGALLTSERDTQEV